jgi:dTDP-4-amino-4,6-dideoxygalactose transaminase
VAGGWSGTFGDAGLYSFDKGKCITSLQGGVIACADDDLAARLERACSALPSQPRADVAVQVAKLLAYFVFLRPRLYWIANAALRLGETPFELDAPMTTYPGALAPLVRRQLERIEEITEQRRKRVSGLLDAITGTPGITIPSRSQASSVYPRLPIVFDDPARRDAVRRTLVAEGIGATGSYPLALRDVPAIQAHLAPGTADTPGARKVAAGILTLPTHAFVADRDIETIAAVVRRP